MSRRRRRGRRGGGRDGANGNGERRRVEALEAEAGWDLGLEGDGVLAGGAAGEVERDAEVAGREALEGRSRVGDGQLDGAGWVGELEARAQATDGRLDLECLGRGDRIDPQGDVDRT